MKSEVEATKQRLRKQKYWEGYFAMVCLYPTMKRNVTREAMDLQEMMQSNSYECAEAFLSLMDADCLVQRFPLVAGPGWLRGVPGEATRGQKRLFISFCVTRLAFVSSR